MAERFLDRLATYQQIADGDAERSDPLHRQQLHGGKRLAELAPAVSEEAQWPCSRNARILLPQRAGGCIARICEDLAPRRFLPFVERFEVGLGHVNLAAHLEDLGSTDDRLRNIADGPHIRRDVFAGCSVTARCRKDQLAALISQRATQSVDLW